MTQAQFAACFGSSEFPGAICGYTRDQDTHTVLTLLAHARPRRVLEIGTALGHMTANFTRWTLDDAQVFSLGIVQGTDKAAAGAPEQQVEHPTRNEFARFADHFGKAWKALFITADSMLYDFGRLAPLDFAFIDGGHDLEPKYVTFINPQPDKGAAVFARIALELGRRRPEIPLLVVEGRGKSDALAGLPVDLSELANLHRMANTPDPRDFYRVSRVVLTPSLWRESLGRVPIEAMANGIRVLASDRGALPETLGDAGFVLTIPERCTPSSGVVPTAQEVAPWVAISERLWDDAEFEAEHRRRALAEVERWGFDRLARQYEGFFHSVCAAPVSRPRTRAGRSWGPE